MQLFTMQEIRSDFKEPERFWSKVEIGDPDSCWEWLAGVSGNGYGNFWIRRGLQWSAHRVAWRLTYGPIPKGLCVLHKCDNRTCCNPYHLFLGTRKDNIIDAASKERLPLQVLTKQEVLEIRELYDTGKWLQRELAKEYGISPQTVSNIVCRARWSWLEEETDEPVI